LPYHCGVFQRKPSVKLNGGTVVRRTGLGTESSGRRRHGPYEIRPQKIRHTHTQVPSPSDNRDDCDDKDEDDGVVSYIYIEREREMFYI